MPARRVPETSRLSAALAWLFECGPKTATALCLGLWAVTPMAWAALAYRYGVGGPSSVGWRIAIAYAHVEATFSLYLAWLALALKPTGEARPFDQEAMARLFRRTLDVGMDGPLSPDAPEAVDFRRQMARWYLDAEWADLRRDDVLQFLAWALCGAADLDRLRARTDSDSREMLVFLDKALALVEARAACAIPPGRAMRPARPIRLELDPLLVASRPLVLYAAINALRWWTMREAGRLGYRHERYGGIEYLLRLPADWTPDCGPSRRPIVFLHGLGVGLPQYHTVLASLASLSDRPAMVLLQPWSSMQIGHSRFLRPPDRGEAATAILVVLRRHGFDRSQVDVLSHSYGTAIAAWMLRAYPELIARSCFVDPIVFCPFHPDVPFNFLYAEPRSGIERLMRYMVATELGHANLIGRRFVWSDNVLWAEDVPGFSDPGRVAVVLSGRDSIVPVARVHRWLIDAGMQPWSADAGGVLLDADAAHGQALMSRCPTLERIFAWLARG